MPSTVAESSDKGAGNAGNGDGLEDVNPEAVEWWVDVQESYQPEDNERAGKLNPAPAFTKGMRAARGARDVGAASDHVSRPDGEPVSRSKRNWRSTNVNDGPAKWSRVISTRERAGMS